MKRIIVLLLSQPKDTDRTVAQKIYREDYYETFRKIAQINTRWNLGN